MKFDMLFYALEVADTGSFSQAARNLYLSQPNLSHAVKQLEDELGIMLFVRQPGGVTVTPEGQELLERFRVIRKEYNQIVELAHGSHTAGMHLQIGAPSSSRAANAFSRICAAHMGEPIRFSFRNYNSIDELIAETAANRLDLAVFGAFSSYQKPLTRKAANAGLEYHSLWKSPVSAVVGKQNPLYDCRDSVSLEQLRPYTLLQPSLTAEDPSHSMFHQIGLSPHPAGEISVNESSVVFELVRNTSAIALMGVRPDSFRKYNSMPDLKILRLRDCTITTQYGWIKLKNRPLSPWAEEYLQILSELY